MSICLAYNINHGNSDTIEELNTILAKANTVQLNLIYGIIKNILELTPIE